MDRGSRTGRALAALAAAVTAAGAGLLAAAPAAAAEAGPWYEIRPQHSRKCLDVAGGGRGNGTNVHQWTCVDAPQQQWRLRRLFTHGQPVYEIIARHSRKCLDVAGGGRGNGANVHQWSCDSRPGVDGVFGSADDRLRGNQLWFTRRVAGYPLRRMVVEIRSRHANRCLDVAGGWAGNGANVHQWACVGVRNQHWELIPV
ncbi:hypothetical protein GCM10010123_42460 [Pilimelia anulata]|uniref:Ricin B lectin domain-containing protein n=1 Tax=Pilimelia anulata TaxID=53371 RepID=A0A8J3FCW2_9ACTN|nr:RICIN domain-containing protein [Pilimelia anulata]GGK08009.1 hypothetical protein GCM10010123_42460 [Pilimelia anulata]